MPDTINFFRERRRQLTKLEVRDRLWFKWAAIAFGVVLAVTFVLFGGRAWLAYTAFNSQKKIDGLKQSISQMEETERAKVVLSAKLSVLKLVFSERSDKQAALAYFTQIFGPQVLIKEIEYDAAQRLLTFGLQTTDVFTLERVFEVLDSDDVAEKFGAVSRSDLRRTNEGAYAIKVVIILPGEVAKTIPKK